MMEQHAGAAGIMITILTAAAVFAIAYFNSSTKLMRRIDELTSRVFTLQDESSACREREADLKLELTACATRIRNLEQATGTTPPPPLAGIVVMDLAGVVKEFSPSLTPILQYLPREMVGRPFTDLLAPVEREKNREILRAARRDPGGLDPGREILTYGLTRSGAQIPIGLTMHGWRIEGGGNGGGLITATIRQRLAASSSSSSSAPSDATKGGSEP